MDLKRTIRKTRVGIVMNDHKIRKTIRVEAERLMKHPRYKKYIKRTSSFLVHDEKEECRTGDRVKIMETRPYSKRKHWMVVQVLEKAKDSLDPLPEVEGIDTPVVPATTINVVPEPVSKKEDVTP